MANDASKLKSGLEKLNKILGPLSTDTPELAAQKKALVKIKNQLEATYGTEDPPERVFREVYLKLINAIRAVSANPLRTMLLATFGKKGEFQFGEEEDSFYSLCQAAQAYFASDEKQSNKLGKQIQKLYDGGSLRNFNWQLAQVLFYRVLQEKRPIAPDVRNVKKSLFAYFNNNNRLTPSESEAISETLSDTFPTLTTDDFLLHGIVSKACTLVTGKASTETFMGSLQALVSLPKSVTLSLGEGRSPLSVSVEEYANGLVELRNTFIQEMNELCKRAVGIEKNREKLYLQEAREKDFIDLIQAVTSLDMYQTKNPAGVRVLQAKRKSFKSAGRDQYLSFWPDDLEDVARNKLELEAHVAELLKQAQELVARYMPESAHYNAAAIALLVIGVTFLLLGLATLLLLAPPVAAFLGTAATVVTETLGTSGLIYGGFSLVGTGGMCIATSAPCFFTRNEYAKQMAERERKITGLISHLGDKGKEACDELIEGLAPRPSS